MTLEVVADLLVCPHCRQPLRLADRTVRCPAGHAFDVARQGYLNLSGTRQPANADTTAMVAARAAFLEAGHYGGVTAHVADLVPREARTIVDCGAGTGYYSAALLVGWESSRALALDVSVAACRRAALAHPRLGAVVADTWQRLPVADDAADLLLCVFAPRNPAEFARLLAPDGRVVTVTPTRDHLVELRQPLGLLGLEADKHERLTTAMAGGFTEVDQVDHVETQVWEESTGRLALAMGPNAYHLSADKMARRSAGLRWPVEVTIGCSIRLWSPTH